MLILGVGLFLLWRGATSQWIDRHLSRAIESALRRCTRLEVRDYVRLLNLSGEYTVTQLRVQPQDWLANDDLQGLNLTREGVTVLGIHRSNGRYVGAPQSDTRIYPGDTLVLYGRLPVLAELDDRCADLAGEASHHRAIAEQERRVKQQDCQEKQENF
ncbi:TrkA C-terminal domain-containing protein [Oxynema sp. CENA135]|uniref:TrkA C-terminal domain-containing protein n=1 Tax=Oxynema sp. CENA135 TaxID=984206 RepID=UPI001F3A6238|nr:TrkA C-terminal domain-containing protein [Oxynema sp. CENA135]